MQNLNDKKTVLNTLIEDILEIAKKHPKLPDTLNEFTPIKTEFKMAY